VGKSGCILLASTRAERTRPLRRQRRGRRRHPCTGSANSSRAAATCNAQHANAQQATLRHAARNTKAAPLQHAMIRHAPPHEAAAAAPIDSTGWTALHSRTCAIACTPCMSQRRMLKSHEAESSVGGSPATRTAETTAVCPASRDATRWHGWLVPASRAACPALGRRACVRACVRACA
jgi:hypothetical protein